MRRLKIGDTVTATSFGGTVVTGKVKDIQICRSGCKEGKSVPSCDIDRHSNGVIDLDCGHWCYFYQVKTYYENYKRRSNTRL